MHDSQSDIHRKDRNSNQLYGIHRYIPKFREGTLNANSLQNSYWETSPFQTEADNLRKTLHTTSIFLSNTFLNFLLLSNVLLCCACQFLLSCFELNWKIFIFPYTINQIERNSYLYQMTKTNVN